MKTVSLGGVFLAIAVAIASAQVAVTTRSYDNGRTGANLRESSFSPCTVRSRGLVRAHRLVLTGDDPRIEAQPLYIPHLTMSDGQVHDVIYIFSMSNRIWAFDADTGQPIWSQPVSLGPPFLAKPGDPVDSKGINRSFGILSTPVIDLAKNTMYVVNWLSDAATHQNRTFQLHALNLADGTEVAGKAPLGFTATVVNAAGKSITFNQVQKQRAALLLAPAPNESGTSTGQRLYIAVTGSENPPANGDPTKANHGWVFAFDPDQWRQTSAWLVTPSSFGGGIWQASQGPTSDEFGNVYLMTSNGGYILEPQKKDYNGETDFAECFVKLREIGNQLAPVDWFSPFRDLPRTDYTLGEVGPNSPAYEYTDQDLGSAGPILIPGTRLVLGAGKDGVLYVLDRTSMGKTFGDFSKLVTPPVFFTFDPDKSLPQYAQARPDGDLDFKPLPGTKTRHLHGSPVYWQSQPYGGMLFVWGENSPLRAFHIDANGKTTLLAQSAEIASAQLADPSDPSLGGMPGGMLALSANGEQDGIIWATVPIDLDANAKVVPGAVRAYDAANFEAEPDGRTRLSLLWEATGFTYSKFCPPVVADGRLIVPTYDGVVDVYTLR